ncbi:hypothetical protein SELMODRAFT_76920 [Selaginella moellendorffii]|uniref:Tryptophan synthase beta chain-like PALP domain-containing protein n=1 Tax=Selaginella moellendorffii TaxID=88036 RepID=D8QTU5_SELML|nr:hypothetical protein SELMODRAFT_76920 [Selaginella moellendorffii]
MQLSGNKLEFLLAEAKVQGADCVITIGGIPSNHCRATAVATICSTAISSCKILLLFFSSAFLLYFGQKKTTRSTVVRFSEFDSVGDMLVEKLRAQERKPYLIPVGGVPGYLLARGYIFAAREIEQQVEAGTCPRLDEIVMACGSGGTTSGLVHGYTVCDSPDYFYDYIQGLASEPSRHCQAG